MPYLVIGPNCWGKGKTEAEAIREAKKAGYFKPGYMPGGAQWECEVFECSSEDFRVDEIGRIYGPKGASMKLIRKIAPKGRK